jgi:hypothetical protein
VRIRTPSRQWRTRADWDGRIIQAQETWLLRFSDGNWFSQDGDPDSTTDAPVDLKLYAMPPEWGIQPGHTFDLFTIASGGLQPEIQIKENDQ